ncbi:hypothetical protein ACOME3_002325 [Neoechinorhynchus agilis]
MSNPKQVEQTIEIEDEPVLDSPMINSLSESQIAETHSELERQPITELVIDLQTDIVKCQKELEIYRNKDEIVKDEINQIRLNLRKYRTMMEQRVEENKNKCKNKARETKSRVTVMLSKLKNEIDDMEVLNNNLRELLTKEKNQTQQLEVEIDDLNVHTGEVERMLARKDRQIDLLNTWIKEFEKTYTSMKVPYHAIQTENDQLSNFMHETSQDLEMEIRYKERSMVVSATAIKCKSFIENAVQWLFPGSNKPSFQTYYRACKYQTARLGQMIFLRIRSIIHRISGAFPLKFH